MSKAQAPPPPPPLKIPFTPEGMEMVSAMLEGMARVQDDQARRLDDIEDRMGLRP